MQAHSRGVEALLTLREHGVPFDVCLKLAKKMHRPVLTVIHTPKETTTSRTVR